MKKLMIFGILLGGLFVNCSANALTVMPLVVQSIDGSEMPQHYRVTYSNRIGSGAPFVQIDFGYESKNGNCAAAISQAAYYHRPVFMLQNGQEVLVNGVVVPGKNFTCRVL